MNLPIPQAYVSPRQRIIEVYVEVRSVPKTAERLGYKSPSFVRKVIHEYRAFLQSHEDSGR